MDKQNKIPKKAIDLTITTLLSIPELHYKSCFKNITGRPEYNCNCPIKNIIDILYKIGRKLR